MKKNYVFLVIFVVVLMITMVSCQTTNMKSPIKVGSISDDTPLEQLSEIIITDAIRVDSMEAMEYHFGRQNIHYEKLWVYKKGEGNNCSLTCILKIYLLLMTA